MSVLTPMYHNITPARTDDIFSVDVNLFAHQLHWLKLTGYQPVTISQIANWLDGRITLSSRSFMLTFDDGYLDNLELALPLLQRFQATACIFITTKWCEAGERQQGTRKYAMLTWATLRRLANAGVEIGAHTLSHPFLTEIDSEAAWAEIYQSKCEIEDRLGLEVQAFSYPNSKQTPIIRDMVQKAGYRLAFGGSSGLNYKNTDRYNLNRPCVYNFCKVPEFLLSISTGIDARAHYRNARARLRMHQKPVH